MPRWNQRGEKIELSGALLEAPDFVPVKTRVAGKVKEQPVTVALRFSARLLPLTSPFPDVTVRVTAEHPVTGAGGQARLETLSREFFLKPVEEKWRIRMALAGRAWRGWFPLGVACIAALVAAAASRRLDARHVVAAVEEVVRAVRSHGQLNGAVLTSLNRQRE